MACPQTYKARIIQSWDVTREHNGEWIPARPLGIGGILCRIKIAWRVFIGQYDALDWEDNQ